MFSLNVAAIAKEVIITPKIPAHTKKAPKSVAKSNTLWKLDAFEKTTSVS